MYCVLGWRTGCVLCSRLEDRVCTMYGVGGQGVHCVLGWKIGCVLCMGWRTGCVLWSKLEHRVCTVF